MNAGQGPTGRIEQAIRQGKEPLGTMDSAMPTSKTLIKLQEKQVEKVRPHDHDPSQP